MSEVFSTSANIYSAQQFNIFSHTYLEQIDMDWIQPTLELPENIKLSPSFVLFKNKTRKDRYGLNSTNSGTSRKHQIISVIRSI